MHLFYVEWSSNWYFSTAGALEKGGVGALELVAMDMKARSGGILFICNNFVQVLSI